MAVPKPVPQRLRIDQVVLRAPVRGCAAGRIVSVTDVERWLADAKCSALAERLVPGTTSDERRQLAALGGLVRHMLADMPREWPEAVRTWAERGPVPPGDVLAEARIRMNGSGDWFATVYEHIVTGPNRRRLGTFFTPPEVVELMLERASAVLPEPAVVVDPGAGVGAFSVAAVTRWPDAKVYAVDVNVVTLGLLAARLESRGESERVALVLEDFISWVQRTNVLGGGRLFLGNPPYTRHQELTRSTKIRALRATGELVDSGLSGLAAYFLGAAIARLADSDALCFVLPGSWTEGRHGAGLRKWMWEALKRPVELLAFPTEVQIFPGTRVNAVIATIGPARSKEATFRTGQIFAGQTTTTRSRSVERIGEPPSSFGPLLWPVKKYTQVASVPLSTLGRVRRGVATGANHFFFLTDDEAKVVPKRLLRPGIRRLRELNGAVLDQAAFDDIGTAGKRRWLLCLAGPKDTEARAVRALLDAGESAGYAKRHLTGIREYWYVVEAAEAPHIILSLMSKDGFRAVLNSVGAIPSNSMYGIHLLDPSVAEALCAWLNSPAGQQAIRSKARHYSNGLLKLEPRNYMTVEVPATFQRTDRGPDARS
jgi:adenine-specific DNA-methyltransferase